MSEAAPTADPEGPIELQREADGSLSFRSGPDQPPVPACRVARCFPWTRPEAYISIRNQDGRELYLVTDVDDLSPRAREVLRQELADTELAPRILRVHRIEDTFNILIWTVDTTSGAVEFQVRHDEDMRVLENDRVIIRDHRGMTFEIPDLAELDDHSRNLVEERLS
jgi:hypothetical protein